jgi:hypothetical protein
MQMMDTSSAAQGLGSKPAINAVTTPFAAVLLHQAIRLL